MKYIQRYLKFNSGKRKEGSSNYCVYDLSSFTFTEYGNRVIKMNLCFIPGISSDFQPSTSDIFAPPIRRWIFRVPEQPGLPPALLRGSLPGLRPGRPLLRLLLLRPGSCPGRRPLNLPECPAHCYDVYQTPGAIWTQDCRHIQGQLQQEES